jgi:hypothetical protein
LLGDHDGSVIARHIERRFRAWRIARDRSIVTIRELWGLKFDYEFYVDRDDSKHCVARIVLKTSCTITFLLQSQNFGYDLSKKISQDTLYIARFFDCVSLKILRFRHENYCARGLNKKA